SALNPATTVRLTETKRISVLLSTSPSDIVTHRRTQILIREHIQSQLLRERTFLLPLLLSTLTKFHARIATPKQPVIRRRAVITDHEQTPLSINRHIHFIERDLPTRARGDAGQVLPVSEFKHVPTPIF